MSGVALDTETNVPAISFAFDGDSLDRACNRTVQDEQTATDFGEREFLAVQLPTALRKGERIVAVAALEARIARFFTCLHTAKEIVKGFLHAPQRVLQHLAMHARDIQASLFDVRQLIWPDRSS